MDANFLRFPKPLMMAVSGFSRGLGCGDIFESGAAFNSSTVDDSTSHKFFSGHGAGLAD